MRFISAQEGPCSEIESQGFHLDDMVGDFFISPFKGTGMNPPSITLLYSTLNKNISSFGNKKVFKSKYPYTD